MSRLTARGPSLRGFLLHLSAPPQRPARRWRSRSSAHRLPVRPMFEALEDYLLLSASIMGTVRNDRGGNGVLSPGAPGVPGETVFLDLDHNHRDQSVTTVAAT